METIFIQYYKSPIGELILGDFKGSLCMADWRFRKMRSKIDERILKALDARFKTGETETTDAAMEQLKEYFNMERENFTIPLLLAGSEFQKKVWKELRKIPFGKTLSYLDLSKQLGDEKAIRAVATANGANAISIFIPCHRILGSKGELTGYAGGLNAKRDLLKLEKINLNPGQYSLF